MTSQEKAPADLLLAALAAARVLIRQPSERNQRIAELETALDALDHALEAEAREANQPEAGHWHPTTWGDTASVKPGARVRVGGQHEAEVEVAMERTWLGSGAAQIPVKLKGRGHYTMPPSGPVEVWVPSLPEWASQAFLALVEGGLSNG